MERERWPLRYHALQAAARAFRQKDVHYQPWAVAAVLRGAALRDRPVRWAGDRRHWATTRLRPARRPSPATVSPRRRRTAFALFLNVLTDRFRGVGLPALVLRRDGKPLVVGGCRQDPDARYGRAAGPVGTGDQLHALWGARPLPEVWAVTPVNEHAVPVAPRLVPRRSGGGRARVVGAPGRHRAVLRQRGGVRRGPGWGPAGVGTASLARGAVGVD